jgi:hypothetical protein
MKELSLTDHGPIVVRTDVERKNNYHEYRDNLRYDFCCSCAYCSITEIEASGIGFEIDHYYPQKHRPELIKEYTNLFWSCKPCNNYKLEFLPDAEGIKKGNVIIRVDEEDPQDHLEIINDMICHKTDKGEFNIELLYLNRLNLRRLRNIRRRFWDANNYIAFGISRIRSIKLDEMPTVKQRLWFTQIKTKIFRKYDGLVEFLKDLPVCSPMLETDPDKKKNLKRRKKYLRNQKAIQVT